MNTAKPMHSTRGYSLYEQAQPVGGVPGRVDVWSDGHWIGYVFPTVLSGGQPWIGRKAGEEAAGYPSRHTALAAVVGGCPDCVCDPVACEIDDSGDSCLDCGYCMNGCSTDECPPEPVTMPEVPC